jgi:hypothetical protein
MKAASCGLLVFVLAMAAGAAGAGAGAAPPAKPGQKEKADPKKPLFLGSDNAKWLPNTNLPTADNVAKLAEKLSSRLRNVDPFGVATFPTDEVVQILEEDPSRPTPRITLNQALQTLKLNGANLSTKEFLIGGRGVFEGDLIELSYKGELFRARVVEVGPVEIVFLDEIRTETGILPHNLIPQLPLEPLTTSAPSLEKHLVPMEPYPTPAAPR